ncbi:hypothetical protein DYB36_012233 [Aphanomyces astaci]|uniref:Myb/SANT-like domain-containing protein n=1 Tax=Aphanomyces astaci TaxID=112090 RepID=A0A397AZY8_APHAT|nr:hypothetical protein DYB36_012233 [Aphanomyces astaci]
MVTALLELRFNAFRNAFNGNKSSKQLSLLWERLTMQFNIATNQAVDADSIKNKLRKLRTEFMVIQRTMARTGNEEPVSRPSYYGDMVTAYAGLHGLGNIEFGLERTPLSEGVDEITRDLEAEDERDSEVDAIPAMSRANKRKAEVDSEISRQRQGRKNAPADISLGLEKFGNTLGAAIIQAANVRSIPTSGAPDMIAQMSKLLEVAENTKASIDSSNEVQMKLLAFLESKF